VIAIAMGIWWLLMLIHILTKPIEDKIVWLLVTLFVPFGFVLYYFIVKRKFKG